MWRTRITCSPPWSTDSSTSSSTTRASPPEAPWLRPLLRSIRWVEHFLASLLAHGCSHDHAVRTYKVFTGFLLGHLLPEAAPRSGDDSPPVAWKKGSGATEDPESHPTIMELQDLLSADHANSDFADGLDALIGCLRLPRGSQELTRPR